MLVIKSTEKIQIEGRDVLLTNIDKIIWPELGLTKFHLIDYYIKIYPYIKCHLFNRPLAFNRFPDGIYGKNFYQKNFKDSVPDWINTMEINSKSQKESKKYVMVDHLSTLVWLSNLGCIEIHPWLSRTKNLDKPDYVVFDLDPMEGVSFTDVKKTAMVLNQVLVELELRGYPKLSGSTGLQVFLPLKPIYTYKKVREFARKVMEVVNELLPDITTLERKVEKRGAKIYLDYMQNVKGKTIAVVYGLRPHKTAPVSAPIKWKELEKEETKPDSFNIFNIFERLEKMGDLFYPALWDKQEI